MRHYQRKIEKRLGGEVSVGYAVDAVDRDGRKAEQSGFGDPVGRITSPGQRAAADRRDVGALFAVGQSPCVPEKHRGVSQQMMREAHRLGPLKMCVTRHDGAGVLLRPVGQSLDQFLQKSADPRGLVLQPEPEIERDLIVPRSRGVELLAGVSDPRRELLLDEHVYVFCLRIEGEPAGYEVGEDLSQPERDRLTVGPGNDAAVGEHPSVGYRPPNILRVHPAVEGDRGVEAVGQRVGDTVGDALPELSHCPAPSSSFRASPAPSWAVPRD